MIERSVLEHSGYPYCRCGFCRIEHAVKCNVWQKMHSPTRSQSAREAAFRRRKARLLTCTS